MSPDCCKECKYLSMDGNCRGNFKRCGGWRTWFRSEWATIQKAAKNTKKNRRTHGYVQR